MGNGMEEKIALYVAILNTIQSKAFHGGLTPADRRDWVLYVSKIREAGFVLRKKSMKNSQGKRIAVIWRAVPVDQTEKRNRHFVAELKKVDMTPDDGKPTCSGNCTTRAMAYCLRGILSYRQIEEKQYMLAEQENKKRGLSWGDGREKFHRNTDGVWDKIMLERGYVWVKLRKSVRRDKLAVILHDLSRPAITYSSGHVAIIDQGKVVDSWDSRHGRCNKILVMVNDTKLVKKMVG